MARDDDRQAHIERVLGDQASDFFLSDLGKFVAGQSLKVIDDNKEELAIVCSTDAPEIDRLQRNIVSASLGLKWLNDAILLGNQRSQIDDLDNERSEFELSDDEEG